MARYRVRFAERPDLATKELESRSPLRVGDVLELRDGIDEPSHAWAVSAVVPGRSGLPDTLVCDFVSRRIVNVSDGAARFAKERGGRIYVWAEPVGSSAAWLQASTDEPAGSREYDRFTSADVDVFVARDVAPPELKVRRGALRRDLVAEWPGGSVPGGSGGGFA
jgi:hypothetical protein